MQLPIATGNGGSRQAFSDLWNLYLPIGAAVFVIVMIVLVAALVRRRDPGPGDQAETPPAEIVYVALLMVIAGLLLWRSYVMFDRANTVPAASAASIGTAAAPEVKITASRWTWRFDYGGGAVQASRSLDAPTELVVPAGVPVRFRLAAADVVHSFWIPAQRTKYDAIPGRINTFAMTFEPGLDYDTARCSEFCGTYHDLMTFRVRVLPPEQFAAWLDQRRQKASG